VIIETIVGTADDQGRPNFAPMGVEFTGGDGLRLGPFLQTNTCRNLLHSRQGVVCLTDDVALMVQTALHLGMPDHLKAGRVNAYVLKDAKTYYEFAVTGIDASRDPARVDGRIVFQGGPGGFTPFCRARFAVVEAAIDATRLHLMAPADVAMRLGYWRRVVHRTGGDQEVEAFRLVEDYINSRVGHLEATRDWGGRIVKKILVHMEEDEKPSLFDQITAYDAGVDHVIPYGGVTTQDITGIVYGAMFTRGGEALRNTAIFVGGSKVKPAEDLLERVLKTFFGPVRVSVMFDANGCNTTAVAAVTKVLSRGEISGKTAVVLAGTGAVGMRVAVLLAKRGCPVVLTSRSLERAAEACDHLKARHQVNVEPAQAGTGDDTTARALEGASIVIACGSPGARLAGRDVWSRLPSIEVMADLNAVEPSGIEGIRATDDGVPLEGKVVFGAVAIGGLKMKIHRRAVETLFGRNDLVLDLDHIDDIAQAMTKG
jgi:hypothetical protein